MNGTTPFADWKNTKISQFGNFCYFYKWPYVRVIAKKILREFWSKHPDSEQQLKAWYREAEDADWKNLGDIKSRYPSASILEQNRVVFNIKGNHYRLIVQVNYHYGMIWIRVIGTHAQYDRIDANKI